MKILIKISTLLVIIIATITFTACKKDIIQTDKPLYDVLIGKTWKYVEYENSTKLHFSKYNKFMFTQSCSTLDTAGIPIIDRWYINADTITIGSKTNHFDTTYLDTMIQLYIRKYGEDRISCGYKEFLGEGFEDDIELELCK